MPLHPASTRSAGSADAATATGAGHEQAGELGSDRRPQPGARVRPDPGAIVSYAEDLARKLSLDTRRVMESPWFSELFPACRLVPGRQRTMELTTTKQGGRLAAGVGDSVLGRGADIIIVDDPIKALDALSEAERRRVAEFYDNTLVTRLNDKRAGAIVIVMQRLHQDDLVGHALERDTWEVVSLRRSRPKMRCTR